MKRTFIVCCFYFPIFLLAQVTHPTIGFERVATGFSDPVDIASANDGTNRLFIVEQRGVIRILNSDGTVETTPFLNIDPLVSSGGERGLLGLAFHPNYSSNGYFYVNYTDNSGDTRVVRYTVSGGNPNIADATSASQILFVDQPFPNHNAGDLEFGPDGYLYIPLGDGGSGGDPGNRSQNTTLLIGKLLRIDVDSGSPYAIPADNPFVGNASVEDEIWGIGLRNPWRFSFDRMTGDIWIGDVGQNAWEEVHYTPASSSGGENYGWRCYEGNATFNTSGCGAASNYYFPVFVYPHSGTNHCSVTGGYVYRGTRYECLQGFYVCADYCSNDVFTLARDGATWSNQSHSNSTATNISAFGEDENGELYAASLGRDAIYRVIDARSLTLDISVMLQGAYNMGMSMMNDELRMNNLVPTLDPYGHGYTIKEPSTVLAVTGANAIVDWVEVELRDGTMPQTILDTRPALLQRDGDVVDVDGSSNVIFACEPAGDYHIAVRHRNHLGVMTRLPYSIGN